jgi:dTDP-glucose 4,6-dehydratase
MILITGAAGFIGLNYIKYLLEKRITNFVVVDKFTYAANTDEFLKLKVAYEPVDIADVESLENIFKKYDISSVINFAAESHVDNSINDCMPFVNSNIIGTVNLLQLSRKYSIKKFLQISTDEVFGQVVSPGKFNEYSNLCPRNPYSASKASAEHFVNAFHNTYKLNTLIVNCSNNYGPYQNEEKLIPKIINNALQDKKIPIYGDGQQIRDWIFVEDACSAIHSVFGNGRFGERYCISGMDEVTNLSLTKLILNKLNKSHSLIEYVTDRLGHDIRYSTDNTRIINELNWEPKLNLSEGLDITIEWIKNESRI